MLKRKKLPIRFYEEYGKLRKLKFDFHQKKTSIKYTSYLSIEMTVSGVINFDNIVLLIILPILPYL